MRLKGVLLGQRDEGRVWLLALGVPVRSSRQEQVT